MTPSSGLFVAKVRGASILVAASAAAQLTPTAVDVGCCLHASEQD